MPYVARKGITLAGVRYGPGEEIPLQDLDLPHKLVRLMLDQRRILLKRGSGAAAGSAKPKLESKAPEAPAATEKPKAPAKEEKKPVPKAKAPQKKKSAAKDS